MTFKGTLYPFQAEAVERMTVRLQMLLAMVMGAGKTPTTIAALEQLMAEDVVARGLIVTPASLKFQWQKQIQKFTDTRSLVIDGNKRTRHSLYRLAHRYPYVICTYDSIINDWTLVRALPRDFVVIDEATVIKGFEAKRSKAIKKLAASVPVKFALSGQPIENRPEELFSIMEFVDPEVLGPFDVFDRTFVVRNPYGRPERYRNLDRLHRRMADAMVRKTREDIADQLPTVVGPVIEQVPFDAKGRELYRIIAHELVSEIEEAMSTFGKGFDLFAHYGRGGKGSKDNQVRGSIMSKLLCLRMLCDTPELLTLSAAKFDANDDDQASGSKGGSQYASELLERGLLDDLPASPKLDATLTLVEDILSEDPRNKVVLFAFFKDALRLIGEAVQRKGLCEVVYFTGDMNARQRDRAKEHFEKEANCRLFLSSDAGGYGVDLPNANYLISYDLPWSAGKLDQRNSRIIRLSSEFESVVLLATLMRGSVEEYYYEALLEKRGIGEAFVDGGYDKQGVFSLRLDSLSDHLRSSEV